MNGFFHFLIFLFILSLNDVTKISSLCHYYLTLNLYKKKKRYYEIDKNFKKKYR